MMAATISGLVSYCGITLVTKLLDSRVTLGPAPRVRQAFIDVFTFRYPE